MLKAVITYGAVAAKVRALKGTMLTEEELHQLCLCSSLAEAAAFLRRHPGYSSAVEALPAANITLPQLQNALKYQWMEQFRRLYRFASAKDRKYISFAIWHTEMKVILSAIRRLQSPETPEPEEPISEFFAAKSGIDLNDIADCRDYGALLRAVKGSVFYDVLYALPRDEKSGLPDYANADIAMQNHLYTQTWALLSKGQSTAGIKKMKELLGHEADLLNIVHAMRLRRFSKNVNGLIPISHRLKPEITAAIAAAANEDEVESILTASGWIKHFSDGVKAPEKQYRRQMEAFCRRLLKSAEPNFCFVQAYLTLKELERDKLISIVQAIDYGIDPTTVLN